MLLTNTHSIIASPGTPTVSFIGITFQYFDIVMRAGTGNLIVTDCQFTSNRAAIIAESTSGTFQLSNSQFYNNNMGIPYMVVAISNCGFTVNSSLFEHNNGPIFQINRANGRIYGCTFTHTEAGSSIIDMATAGPVTISNTSFSENSVTSVISSYNTAFTLQTVHVFDNQVADDLVATSAAATTSIYDSVFDGNTLPNTSILKFSLLILF